MKGETHLIKMAINKKIIVVISILIIWNSINFVHAYSLDSEIKNQNLDLNQTTRTLSDSIKEITDNVLKSFAPSNKFNGMNSNIPQNVDKDASEVKIDSKFFTPDNISSSEIIKAVVEFMKLSINLLFMVLYIFIEILKGLLGALNSY